jgi:poly-gamma-glutamate synthesis protein (capsule biosynthesis protein)
MWRRDNPLFGAILWRSLQLIVLLATSSSVYVNAQPFALFGHGDKATGSRAAKPAHTAQGVSVAAVGDIMLGSWVVAVLEREGADYPFRALAHRWAGSDLVVGNLEAPFTEGGTPFEKSFTFRVPPPHAVGLKQAGFNLLSLANNHILDFGIEGLISTLETLEGLGISTAGAGRSEEEACAPAYLEMDGQRIAFLAYSLTFPVEFYARADTAGTCFPRNLEDQVRAARQAADFVIVSFHWGAEKRTTPKPYQVEVAHRAIDAGADLVVGHHPHVLQGLEVYHNRLIAYSLGNFAFGSYSSTATSSILLKVFLNRDGLVFARCIPINVNNVEVEFQPRLLTGVKADSVIAMLDSLSRDLNGGRSILSEQGIVLGATPLRPLPLVPVSDRQQQIVRREPEPQP